MDVSHRLERWIRFRFDQGSAEPVLEELRALSTQGIGGQDPERVQAALVLRTNGDWPHRLDEVLGDEDQRSAGPWAKCSEPSSTWPR
jgi:hypothetical protein